jgi:hypothetical protein
MPALYDVTVGLFLCRAHSAHQSNTKQHTHPALIEPQHQTNLILPIPGTNIVSNHQQLYCTVFINMMFSLKCLTKASRLRGLGTHSFQAMTTVVQGKESFSDGSWTGKNKDSVTMAVTMVGVATAVISGVAVATAYTVSTTKDLHEKLTATQLGAQKDIAAAQKDIEAVKLEAKKDMELTKMEAQKDIAAAQKEIAAAKMEAQKEIAAAKIEAQLETGKLVAEAKKETAERFLMFGYAAEFQEYRKQLKLGDHGKEETSAAK